MNRILMYSCIRFVSNTDDTILRSDIVSKTYNIEKAFLQNYYIIFKVEELLLTYYNVDS